MEKRNEIEFSIEIAGVKGEVTKAGQRIFLGIALRQAAADGNPEAVAALLEAGADFEERDYRSGDTPLIIAATSGCEECVRLLIEAGADVAAGNDHGFTALDVAVLTGAPGCTMALIEAGADPEALRRLPALVADVLKEGEEE